MYFKRENVKGQSSVARREETTGRAFRGSESNSLARGKRDSYRKRTRERRVEKGGEPLPPQAVPSAPAGDGRGLVQCARREAGRGRRSRRRGGGERAAGTEDHAGAPGSPHGRALVPPGSPNYRRGTNDASHRTREKARLPERLGRGLRGGAD